MGAGFRERLMADPSFFVKVGIECGIGICTKGAAEYEKRKGRFAQELDFVTANVIMAIIADFMLVWLPAPTMSFSTANSCRAPTNALQRFFSCCPDNAFQKVPESATQPS
jgi:Protein RETICULATA-related